MRRAVQRCSASLRRNAISSSSQTSTVFGGLRSGCNGLNSVTRSSQPSTRLLHQRSRLLQQAAAQVAYEDSPDGNSAGAGKITRFAELGTQNVLHRNVVSTLTRDMGLETMTEVQTATINEALKGTDIIAQARTGTGKTLAFLLPILQNIINVDPQLAERVNSKRAPRTTADDIRAIIISPTRELAEQIAMEARKLVQNTGVIVQTAVGGTQKSAGLRAIQRQGCHLLVGTPGRLKDVLSDPYTRVEAPDLTALVFDEADRLLDQGFWPEIQEIMRLLPTPAEKDRQTMMFSATVPREVVDLVRTTLKPGFQFVKTVRDDEEPTHTRVPQHIATVNGFENKLPALVELSSRAIEAGRQPGGRPFKAIVYYNSTAEVTLAASALRSLQAPPSADSPPADGFGQRRQPHPWYPTRIFDIHARLTQVQRTRAAEAFRNCESGILLSSDVTARGMDFPNVTHVIQMAAPPNREQYIHRIGRTGRAGREGEGWLIVSPEEADECRYRLKKLPLKPNDTLVTASINMTQEAKIPASAGRVLEMVRQAMTSVSDFDKAAVYRALLGVYGWLGNKRVLVSSMNNLAQYGWSMPEPPMIAPGLATRLGISRIPGVRLGHDDMVDPNGRSSGRDARGGGFGGDRGGDRDSRSGGFGGRPREDRFGSPREDRFGGSSGGPGGFGGGSSRGGYGGGSSRGEYSDRGDRGDRSSSRGGFGERDSFGSRDRGFARSPRGDGEARQRY